MSYKLDLRKSVASMFGKRSTEQILEAFKDKPISRATIFRVLRDCREGKQQENKKKSGRPVTLNSKTTKNLLANAKDTVEGTHRKLARKYGVSPSTVHRILKRNHVQVQSPTKATEYTAKQLKEIPKCCRALLDQHFTHGKVIIMDDERYFTFTNNSLDTDDSEATTDDEKSSANKMKFQPKVLMWIAISSTGCSSPYFQSSTAVAFNSDEYIDKCLPKLKQFIDKKHASDKIIFWPDPARGHYAKNIQEWLESEQIESVPQTDNPPNVPQARPMQRFWKILWRKVYENDWTAQSHHQLIGRIRRKLNEIDESIYQRMMESIPSKLREIEENGP